MTRKRVSAHDRRQRQKNFNLVLKDVGAVVLETDGSMSVLPRVDGEASSLEGVRL